MPSATFATLLQSHLQTPCPGCIFIQATTTSDQLNALRQIRLVCKTISSQADPRTIFAELHPNLVGNRVIDVRNDIIQAFQPDLPESSSSTSTSTASTVSIYPDQDRHHNTSAAHRILAIPSAHLLRSTHSPQIWSQLLYPPKAYTIILVSSVPLDRWRTAEGVENLSGHRPIVKMSFACHQEQEKTHKIDSVLSNLLSKEDEQEPFPSASKFQSTFITFALAALTAEVSLSDVEEIQYLTLAVWRALCAVVNAPEDSDSAAPGTQRLLSILRPLLRSALNTLHPRQLNVEEWIQQQVVEAEPHGKGNVAHQQQRTRTPHLLAPIPSLLLLAAFLCSHIPSKSDSRLFLRDEATLPNFSLRSNSSNKRQRRARKKSANETESHNNHSEDHSHGGAPTALLLGPKPFPYQRMMYVFQNLCVEFDVKQDTLQQEYLRRQRNSATPTKADQEPTPHIDVFTVAIHRELQRLIARDYIFVVSPPFSTLAHYHDDDEATAPPPPPSIPLRLEHLNQITMRCNLLKEEVKQLVVPLSHDDNNTTHDRKQWWTRVEECGL